MRDDAETAMPIHYVVDPARGLVRVDLEGAVAPPDVADYRRALLSDPECSPDLPRLLDLRRVALPPTTAQVRDLALSILSPGQRIPAKRAVVAERDAVYGMFRMLETLADERPPRVRVFRREAEALSWLGVDAGTEEAE